jgi:hypothetical protein
MLDGNQISWCTRRQPIVALSSTEAEYIAAADCVKELLYLKTLVEDQTNKAVEVNLFVNNKAQSIKLMKNCVFNRRSKHIDVRYHFLTENIQSGKINVSYISTSGNVADMFTKPLGNIKFKIFKTQLVGLIE